jgi:hypothetical protein
MGGKVRSARNSKSGPVERLADRAFRGETRERGKNRMRPPDPPRKGRAKQLFLLVAQLEMLLSAGRLSNIHRLVFGSVTSQRLGTERSESIGDPNLAALAS